MVRSHATERLTTFLDDHDRIPETFRAIVQALDHPGTMVNLEPLDDPPAPLHAASAAVMETLINPEAPVWVDLDWNSPPANWLQTACSGSLVTEPSMAAFALITQPARMPSLFQFLAGQPERSEASTTLILQVKGLSWLLGQTLPFPERRRFHRIAPSGLSARFWSEWKNQSLQQKPAGMDVLFTWKNSVVAMPGNMILPRG